MKKRRKPLRDSRGRFKKRYIPPRDSRGRFRQDRRKHRKAATAKRVQKALAQPREREYDLCNAAEREQFYEAITADRRKALQKNPDAPIIIQFEVHGDIRKRRTKNGKISKRRTTSFIGKRTWSDLRKFKRFLLLDTGQRSGLDERNPFGVDWTKRGLCQFRKEAVLITPPETRRGRVKVHKRYNLKG